MSKKKKKHRVIHTRVSEDVEEELKERAAALGVSVSNLVRNVLQNALGLVEDIVADSASLARSARGDGYGARHHGPVPGSPVAPPPRPPPVPSAPPEPPPRPGAVVTAPPPPPAPSGAAWSAPIVAWQPAVLNLNAICSECNDILPRGTQAAIALTDRPGSRPVLCTRCLEELRHDSSQPAPSQEPGRIPEESPQATPEPDRE